MKYIKKEFSNRQPDLTKCSKIRIPKDYPWRVLKRMADDLSDCGSISDCNYELISQICRDKDFYSYQLLDELWGLQSINSSDAEVSEKMALYQLSALLKKFQFDTSKHERIKTAFDKFLQAEETCFEFNHGGYTALTWPDMEFMVDVFTYAKDFCQKILGDSPNQRSLVEWTRHGPGSTTSTSNGKNSAYFKYAEWPYDCTARAVPYARFVIGTDQRWMRALKDDYRLRHNIHPMFEVLKRDFWSEVFNIVDGNRITFVPKNANTERSIAIEPTLNLYLQLGVDGFIRRKLKRFDIDLDDQTKNQRMAKFGSLSCLSNDQYVTIDMKAASDTISTKLCQLLLPPDWYSYLMAIRSPKGTIAINDSSQVIEYEKISSMGNGFTFALESLIFAAVTSAVIRKDSGKCNFKTDLAVFGDDIICKKMVVKKVVYALQCCGFALNLDKSFLSGSVKESCGTDWVNGRPFRPVYLTKSPSDVLELFSDRNRIRRTLFLRYGLNHSSTQDLLDRWVPELFRTFIGPNSDEDFDSYLHCSTPYYSFYKFGAWQFRRLIRKPIKYPSTSVTGHDFRKLMHNLKPRVKNIFEKVVSSGNRFDVVKRNLFVISVKNRARTTYWNESYAESTDKQLQAQQEIQKIVESWRIR